MTNPPDAFHALRLLYQNRIGPYGVALFANIGSLPQSTCSLDPNAELRQASAEEKRAFAQLVISHGTTVSLRRRNPFETRIVRGGRTPDGLDRWGWEPLPVQEFRYHVLDYRGPHAWINHVISAGVLVGFEFVEALDFSNHAGCFGGGASRDLLPTMTQGAVSDEHFVSLTNSDVDELASVQKKLQQHDERLIPLRQALEEYLELRQVRHHGRLVFLGLFSLLEMLITHRPNGGDRYDAITHQVATKIKLLNERFETQLEYDVFKLTDKTTSRNVWTKLYALRSTFAHGRPPDFDNDLQMLRDVNTALAFVRSTLRKVMRIALEEPRLLADLRDC